MTLEEEIKRLTDNAEYERTHGSLQGCLDFRQLIEWLKELKQLRERQKVRFNMISVKMFDAENGVEKTVRHLESIAIYNGQMHCKESEDVSFIISADELEHYAFYISDDIITIDDWGE